MADYTGQSASELRTHIENSRKDLEQLSFIISHDLQEPLRMIASYVQLLQKKYKGSISQEADEYIEYAVDGVRRMKVMLHDMLSYLCIDSDDEVIQTVDCGEVLKEVRESLINTEPHNTAEIKYENLPKINCKPTQIKTLFRNIVMSAIQFSSSAKPEINVTCRRIDDKFRFSIRDNGTSVDPDEKDKMFLMFQKLNAAGGIRNTGAELAICKKIAERHNGNIGYDSVNSGGSDFYLELPARN